MGAQVRERTDGHHELVLNGEVHSDDRDRVKNLSGMSVTLFVTIGDDDEGANITLAADHHLSAGRPGLRADRLRPSAGGVGVVVDEALSRYRLRPAGTAPR